MQTHESIKLPLGFVQEPHITTAALTRTGEGCSNWGKCNIRTKQDEDESLTSQIAAQTAPFSVLFQHDENPRAHTPKE